LDEPFVFLSEARGKIFFVKSH
jgi:hypothetical protein